MCGIAGIVGAGGGDLAADRAIMLRMLGLIRHRGPDQFGVYQDGTATLGSARLSIIDLSSGQQPIGNEDGTLWIVFNGEIFNYVELRPGPRKARAPLRHQQRYRGAAAFLRGVRDRVRAPA